MTIGFSDNDEETNEPEFVLSSMTLVIVDVDPIVGSCRSPPSSSSSSSSFKSTVFGFNSIVLELLATTNGTVVEVESTRSLWTGLCRSKICARSKTH